MLLSCLGFLLPKYPREKRLLLLHHFSKLTAKLIPAKAQPKSSTLKPRYPVSLFSSSNGCLCLHGPLLTPGVWDFTTEELLALHQLFWPGLTCSRSLEQRACVLSRFSRVWLLAPLWTAARQAPQIPQARTLEWIVPSSREPSRPRGQTRAA